MAGEGPELDLDRLLALSYVPAARRHSLHILWRLDAAFGAVLAGGREPLISRIKLAWWRDSLARLDTAPAPAEPLLQGVSEQVLPLAVSGSELAGMEEGWAALLTDEAPGPAQLAAYADARGGLLFRHSAALLGAPSGRQVEQGGAAWALVDLARRSGRTAEADAALAAARERLGAVASFCWPTHLRPLGMLTMVAARDAEEGRRRFEPQGGPGRMLRMLRHRLTGR